VAGHSGGADAGGMRLREPLRRHRPDMAKVLEQLQKLESSPSSAPLRSPRLLRCLKNEDDASSSSSASEESQGASAVEAQLRL